MDTIQKLKIHIHIHTVIEINRRYTSGYNLQK